MTHFGLTLSPYFPSIYALMVIDTMTLVIDSIYSVQISEIVILSITLSLLMLEVKALIPTITNRISISLLGFLVFLSLIHVSRIVGIMQDSILIRTYLSALLALLGTLLYLDWGTEIIRQDIRTKIVLFLLFTVFMVGFVTSRSLGLPVMELIFLTGMIMVVSSLMILIFRYVFSSSPYIRARHRLFVLTVSFVLYTIVEGMAVTMLSENSFALASMILLLSIPPRIGMTLSILLPDWLTSFLSKFIN